jgi:hypothetical protein
MFDIVVREGGADGATFETESQVGATGFEIMAGVEIGAAHSGLNPARGGTRHLLVSVDKRSSGQPGGCPWPTRFSAHDGHRFSGADAIHKGMRKHVTRASLTMRSRLLSNEPIRYSIPLNAVRILVTIYRGFWWTPARFHQ